MKQGIYIVLLGTLLSIVTIPVLFSQHRVVHPNLSSIAIPQQTPGWIHFREDLNLNSKTVFQDFKTEFSLKESETMVLKSSETDAMGYVHDRYQLHHKGIPVEGAIYILHAKDGIAKKANGFLPADLDIATSPQIGQEQALNLALAHMNADAYMWETQGSEDALKHAHKDPTASFMPEAELMIAATSFIPENQDYRLVWKLDIYAAEPHSRKWIYVNAIDGSIVKDLETLHTSNSVGIAETKYSGTQTIVADSLSPSSYRLRENNRGESATYSGVDIETYDLNESEDFSQAVDFLDEDNYWDNANLEFDEAATDAHWGTEMTHDFFWQKFGLSSYDGNGSPMISYVHFGDGFFNAFWNGVWMTYGDGNNAPLTSIDVVGHEMAHGVTGNSAGLIYAYESGALNESFSDIFGNAIEHFASPSLASWLVGEGFGTPLRNMANPNAYSNPDTYRGASWWTATGDNGGVHYNSGVQNFWFYLLVEGGSGVNDFGESYDVPAVGWEVATQIAFRNLTTYLTPYSQYADARAGALEAAIDVYGLCSPEYQAVAEAWYAVGVGPRIKDNDFGVVSIRPIDICGTSSEEYLSIEIGYFGCDTFAGGQILATYSVSDPFASATESVVLPSMKNGDLFSYEFSQPLQMEQVGEHTLVSRTLSPIDPIASNDSSAFFHAFRKGFFSNERIDFDNYANSFSILDSIHFDAEEEASVSIQGQVGTDSTFAIRMEGGSRERFRIFLPPGDPASFNTQYQTRACMCVDAEKLDSLSVSFDLRQTFSPFWSVVYSGFIDSTFTSERVNILRLMLNNQELARFHPTSYEKDPWTTHDFNLDAFVGEPLSLCFLATLNQSKAADNFEIGDYVYLDNINFSSVSSPISSIGNAIVARELQAYPNPTQEFLTIDYTSTRSQTLELSMTNALGQVVKRQSWETASGNNQIKISVTDLSSGLYSLQMKDESGWLVKKIVVE